MMSIYLNNKMPVEQIKTDLQMARKELENNPTIKPQIKKILHYVLNYADKYFCWRNSPWIIQAERYAQVSELFNLGVTSSQSLDDEKKFYTQAQQLLGYTHETRSKLRNRCLPAIKYHEAKLMHDLEQNDPQHKNAVNGIISATVGLGFISSFVSDNPYWFIVSLFVFAGKLTPATSYMHSPSLFGRLVYENSTVRHWGHQLYSIIPIDFSSSSIRATCLKPKDHDDQRSISHQ